MSPARFDEGGVFHHGRRHAAASVLAALIEASALAGCVIEAPAVVGAGTHSSGGERPAERGNLSPGSAGELSSPTPEPPSRLEEPHRNLPVHAGAGSAPSRQARTAGLQLPAGFSFEGYSPDAADAPSLATGPKGVVFVSTRDDDKVYALIDANGDHRVDGVEVVASGLDLPSSISYRDGALFIAEVGRTLRIDGIDARIASWPAPNVATDQVPDHEHQGWRYIRFGPDGWLYIPTGDLRKGCFRDEGRAEARVTTDLPGPTLG